jgi:hypothetical protein
LVETATAAIAAPPRRAVTGVPVSVIAARSRDHLPVQARWGQRPARVSRGTDQQLAGEQTVEALRRAGALTFRAPGQDELGRHNVC